MSGSHWASVFDECAKKLLGESADELAKLRKYNPDAYSEYFRKPLFKTYSFRIVSRNQDVSKLQQQQHSAPSSDNNSNQKMLSSKKVSKMRWSVLDLMPIDYDVHIQLLEGYIRKYTSK
ncbi:unnamed protein product [Anisakis simplex]|uniref:Rep_fac-A_C domain-containing protein n=1 Tax=Anisakis simplex TaxID=6269 RepID=A0A0M3KK73_ANISI|nr:unnamed protein product [Anisakis simplex]